MSQRLHGFVMKRRGENDVWVRVRERNRPDIDGHKFKVKRGELDALVQDRRVSFILVNTTPGGPCGLSADDVKDASSEPEVLNVLVVDSCATKATTIDGMSECHNVTVSNSTPSALKILKDGERFDVVLIPMIVHAELQFKPVVVDGNSPCVGPMLALIAAKRCRRVALVTHASFPAWMNETSCDLVSMHCDSACAAGFRRRILLVDGDKCTRRDTSGKEPVNVLDWGMVLDAVLAKK